nr:hypothetical protein [Tanacetum cinerariifolium]
VINSTAVFGDYVNLEMKSSESCDKCSDLDAELLKNKMQYFENNDLKALIQAKDTTIRNLKEHIKSMTENDTDEKVKHDMDEIETINIELEHTNLDDVDLLSGSRGTNLYMISLDDMLNTSSVCLLSKASNTKSWLWHRRLSHLNFGKSKKSSHQSKADDTNQEKLNLLHLDLCGPDEAPKAIIKCIKNIQVRLNAIIGNVRTDHGTEFVNQTLQEFYENVGISHQTFIGSTPQQNDVVER